MAKSNPFVTYYSLFEEKINVLSHGTGILLSILAMVFLAIRAAENGDGYHISSAIVFGSSLILLYAASTLYHSAKSRKWRYAFNIIDHASIYILIAGTYTPFTLITLNGKVGWTVFGVIWGLAIVGAVLKLFFAGRYNLFSTIMYVLMGWIIVFASKPLIASLSTEGLVWLAAGGVFYTIGAVFFILDKIKLNHAIFHIFVLLGSFCHFVSIYYYVLTA